MLVSQSLSQNMGLYRMETKDLGDESDMSDVPVPVGPKTRSRTNAVYVKNITILYGGEVLHSETRQITNWFGF